MQTADHSKQVTLRNECNERNTQSKTLHIYMLCSHPDVQVHARTVAVSPISATTNQQLQDLEYDLTIIESVLSIFLGTIMSPEGEKVTRPIVTDLISAVVALLRGDMNGLVGTAREALEPIEPR